ncbi:MAG: glycosyltransferase [Nitrosopumilaceae archaeon]
MNPILSIIIPTHNSESTIKRCLDSLLSQSIPREQFEIIIVDDGSKDKTVQLANECKADNIIVIEPCFQGKARNIGAKNAKGEFLAFIDSDCAAKDGWIGSIISELKKLDAVTGPITNGNSQSNVAWTEYLIEFGGWDEYRQRSPVRFLPGCNQAYKKSAFEKTDGFTETPSSEDVLFGESLRKAGIIPQFSPMVNIEHLCRTEKEKVLKNMKLLGKYSARTRKSSPSIAYSSLMSSPKLVGLLFVGKLFKTFDHSIKARKLTKFILTFPLIVKALSSFCNGVREESRQ